jgi:galactokinase
MDSPLVNGTPVNPGSEVLAEEQPSLQTFLKDLYGNDAKPALTRYTALQKKFVSTFGKNPSVFVSAPGRVEIGGNHTDHNNGRVIAASVTLDLIGAAAKSNDNTITLVSEGYPTTFRVALDQLHAVEDERITTLALIRGIAARCAESGYAIGGFHACVESQVTAGSGLSSSACIEMFIGMVLNALYNRGKIPVEQLAAIGQYAENVYFGKPCGLMDQLACGVGGIVAIDLGDPAHPGIYRIPYTLEKSDLRLAVVHTGGSHADLTGDYAAIPKEMRAVAKALGGSVLRDVTDATTLLKAIPALRTSLGDRAVLRALHYLHEMDRVQEQVRSLEEGRVDDFLAQVNASGRSSAMVLQNSYPAKVPAEQGITLALTLTAAYLEKVGQGACRVHGGGFAGTILAILPWSAVDGYRTMIEGVFGKGSLCLLDIRPTGTTVFERAPL